MSFWVVTITILAVSIALRELVKNYARIHWIGGEVSKESLVDFMRTHPIRAVSAIVLLVFEVIVCVAYLIYYVSK